MDCGKTCMSESKAKALCLLSQTYRRAYYCRGCRCWHTTSQPLPAQPERPQYRTTIKRSIG